MTKVNDLRASIISAIYEYFPKNITDADDLYWATKEFLNLKAKCQEVSENNGTWDNFHEYLRELFPYYLIIDKTEYFDFDRGFSLVITFENKTNEIKYFEVFVSYIVPCYTISLTETNGKGNFNYNINPFGGSDFNEKIREDMDAIQKGLLKFFPYYNLEEAMGRVVLSDIAFQNMYFGDVNIFKAVYINNIFLHSKP